MKPTIEYKPVLEPLFLREYHPEYGDEAIQVCVNPSAEFMAERDNLQKEYATRYAESARYVQLAKGKKRTEEQEAEAEQKVIEFLDWNNDTFLVKADEWFARLWSFGEDKYSLDDIRQIGNTDAHFLTWLKNRSIEMIEEHKAGRKKNSIRR